MKHKILSTMGILVAATMISACASKTKTEEAPVVENKVYFISPKDGETVKSPVTVKMGLEGMAIRKAGEAPDEKTTGHHHILVDKGPVAEGMPIPNDAQHIHFGKGEAETTLKLKKGVHTLTLQFADGAHRSYGEKMSQTIKITVK